MFICDCVICVTANGHDCLVYECGVLRVCVFESIVVYESILPLSLLRPLTVLLSFHLLCLIVFLLFSSAYAADEDPLKEDGPYSCVHCRLPQHSKEPRTQKPNL